MTLDTTSANERGIERLSTGSPQFDEILSGGIPKGSINILMGHPGTGKTIFAEQLVFHNANGGRPILYLTTLSEPLSKVITYLQGFSFYDEEKMLGSVVYEDIGEHIATQGPAYIVDHVREAIRDTGPQIIVIDSFKAIHELSDSPAHSRRIVAELGRFLSAYDATVFLVGEYAEEHIPRLPEFAVADGIIEFVRMGSAKRDERFVRISKLRGSAYAQGLHAFSISQDGIHVYPRLVTPDVPTGYRASMDRVSTGIEPLDGILAGGLWRGSTTLVVGPAGTGKTTLGLQFALAGVAAGERSLYVNFQENPTQLARTIRALGHDINDLHARGLAMLYFSPVELRIDSVVIELFDTIMRDGITRVVVDALGDLALRAGDRERFHDYLYSLCQHFTVSGVTALLTMEASQEGRSISTRDDARFSSMCDTIIELKLEIRTTPCRTLRVVKARGAAHDLRVHEMVIDAHGIAVTAPVTA